jgi:hypothetical protein
MVTDSSLQSFVDDVKADLAPLNYALVLKEPSTFDEVYPHFAIKTKGHAFQSMGLPPRSDNPDEVVM